MRSFLEAGRVALMQYFPLASHAGCVFVPMLPLLLLLRCLLLLLPYFVLAAAFDTCLLLLLLASAAAAAAAALAACCFCCFCSLICYFGSFSYLPLLLMLFDSLPTAFPFFAALAAYAT